MSVALIPPKGLEHHMWRSNTQMALAHLMADEKYWKLVKEIASMPSNHVIMDNGANEHSMVPGHRLKFIGECIRCELVLPDNMGHAENTLELVKLYLATSASVGVKYMAVVHGASMKDAQKLIGEYVEISKIKTLGLPRMFPQQTMNKSARLDLARWVVETYPDRFDIHLLGMNPVWVQEIKAAGKYYGDIIRSVDSSAPYNFAIQNLALDRDCKEIVRRPVSYYLEDWSEGKGLDMGLVKHNEEVLQRWASGTN